MIPSVLLADLCWLGLVVGLERYCRSRVGSGVRLLMRCMIGYVILEALAHGPMEDGVAGLVGWWR